MRHASITCVILSYSRRSATPNRRLISVDVMCMSYRDYVAIWSFAVFQARVLATLIHLCVCVVQWVAFIYMVTIVGDV